MRRFDPLLTLGISLTAISVVPLVVGGVLQGGEELESCETDLHGGVVLTTVGLGCVVAGSAVTFHGWSF